MSSHSSFDSSKQKKKKFGGPRPFLLKRATTIMKSNIDLEHTDHLKSETDENIRMLLCNLCKNVLIRPMVCSGCQGTSCETCINDWGINHPRCPNGCKDFKYTKTSKIVNSNLNKLKIKCENHSHGCKEVLRYQDIEYHHEVCEYAIVHCKNEGCNEVLRRGEMNIHEAECIHERHLCLGCEQVITRGNAAKHNCVANLNTRLSKTEGIVKEFITKMESAKETTQSESKGKLCTRHEFIQDYSLEFSVFHQPVNHYQITLPEQNLPVSEETRCVILRVVVHDCAVANLFTRCSIRQVGLDEGINLSNYIIPISGAPMIFEAFLPWSSEHPAQISIQWEKSPYACVIPPPSIMDKSFFGKNMHSSTI